MFSLPYLSASATGILNRKHQTVIMYTNMLLCFFLSQKYTNINKSPSNFDIGFEDLFKAIIVTHNRKSLPVAQWSSSPYAVDNKDKNIDIYRI